ncbi:MAG: ABC transporter ATP-binding protein/permease [Candidatus Obscuribacterales bacterium]|nr:ABC transporter ATP-binding protein/permease [Candidatus Obscuribacterales bacterium]
MTAFQLLYKSVQKFPGWLAVNFFLGLVSASMSGFSVALVAPLVLELLGQPVSLPQLPKVFGPLASLASALPSDNRVAMMSWLLILLFALKGASAYLSSLASYYLTGLCATDLRARTLDVLLQADMGYFSEVKPGQLVSALGAQVDQTAKILVVLSQLLAAILTIAVYIVIMICLSPSLTIAAFALFVVAFSVNNSIIRSSRLLGRQSIEQAAKLTAALYQTFGGIRVVKATTSESREREKLLGLSKLCVENTLRAGAGASAIAPLTEFTGMAAIVSIVLLGKVSIPSYGDGVFSTALLTFLFILFRMLAQVNSLNGKRNELSNSWPNAESLAAFIGSNDKNSQQNGTAEYTPLKESIQFQDVTFSYKRDKDPVLRGINLTIPQGTALAIVGPSGAGKTTIADLISRYYDPTSGCIKIDNRDLRDFDLRSLRRHISVVSQDPFLFNETIGYNIEYSRPTASKAELIEAARRAHALDFIERLPLGFDSPVGERGALLSAGERQRISIARAILTDPDIFILDEATSALDSLSEQIVQTALEELMRNRTTLIIAHRLSTVRRAEQIAVLHNGQIAEVGSHAELIAIDGMYKRMCEAGSVLIDS